MVSNIYLNIVDILFWIDIDDVSWNHGTVAEQQVKRGLCSAWEEGLSFLASTRMDSQQHGAPYHASGQYTHRLHVWYMDIHGMDSMFNMMTRVLFCRKMFGDIVLCVCQIAMQNWLVCWVNLNKFCWDIMDAPLEFKSNRRWPNEPKGALGNIADDPLVSFSKL